MNIEREPKLIVSEEIQDNRLSFVDDQSLTDKELFSMTGGKRTIYLGREEDQSILFYRVDKGLYFRIPDHEIYYNSITERNVLNNEPVPIETQNKHRNRTYIVFGVGSSGGDAAMMLAQFGAEHFIVCDMDNLDFSNLNRQHGDYSRLGEPKVEIISDDIHGINPFASVNSYYQKILPDDVDKILHSVDPENTTIVWTMDDRDAMLRAHELAQKLRIDIFSCWDIAHAGRFIYYGYSKENTPFYSGRVKSEDAKKLSMVKLIGKELELGKIPLIKDLGAVYRMPLEYRRTPRILLNSEGGSIPQVATASELSAALITTGILLSLQDIDIKTHHTVDLVDSLVSTRKRFSRIKSRIGDSLGLVIAYSKHSEGKGNL